MTKTIQAIRGMNDALPEQTPVWQYAEATLKNTVERYGYHEVRMPIVEYTDLFRRSVGEVTDIVEKEMYSFEDKGNESLTLRPEGTAGCVRAGIEHGLFYNQTQRLWYKGPMFRYERPQKGRYRQFHQFGIEAFGLNGPDIDAEIILMTARLWKLFGFESFIKLQLNSLGDPESRKNYHKILVDYFSAHQNELDEDSKRRLLTNPLRILDSKNPDMKELVQNAPKLIEHLDAESKEHFKAVCEMLDQAGLSYEINPCLVRGLDYYTKTVFEWVTDKLGSQGAVCGGGRFDLLVEQMGGKPTSAIGFSIGLERLIAMLTELNLVPPLNTEPDVYLILAGNDAMQKGLLLAENLRNNLPLLKVEMSCGDGSFKTQFKRADKSGAKIAIILGDTEIQNQIASIKYLREEKPQETMAMDELTNFLQVYFNF